MLCEVLKPFQALDRELMIGEQVDTTGWREVNRDNLIARRYLKPVESPTSGAPALKRRDAKERER
jgi:hypothetical protein